MEEAFVHTAIRRPYTNVFCGRARDSVKLGIYGHTRRPFAGPDMLAVQIEERRAELAFLRTVWPQGSTQPIDHEVTPSPPVLPPPPAQWQPRPGSSPWPWRHVSPRTGNAGVVPDGGDESEPGGGDATTATTRTQQPPPAPLGRSGNEHAASLPHRGVVVSAQPGRAKPIGMSGRENHPKLAHNRGSAQAVVAPRAGTTIDRCG